MLSLNEVRKLTMRLINKVGSDASSSWKVGKKKKRLKKKSNSEALGALFGQFPTSSLRLVPYEREKGKLGNGEGVRASKLNKENLFLFIFSGDAKVLKLYLEAPFLC